MLVTEEIATVVSELFRLGGVELHSFDLVFLARGFAEALDDHHTTSTLASRLRGA